MVKPAFDGRFFIRICIMPEGKCPKCGQRYYGWALLQPRNQSCVKCGAGLLITEDNGKPFRGYSPFTAEEYKIKKNQLNKPNRETEEPAIDRDNEQ
jgi:hypothetical protein